MLHVSELIELEYNLQKFAGILASKEQEIITNGFEIELKTDDQMISALKRDIRKFLDFCNFHREETDDNRVKYIAGFFLHLIDMIHVLILDNVVIENVDCYRKDLEKILYGIDSISIYDIRKEYTNNNIMMR